MEKASIIFSILIHSDDFMFLFWGALGILNMLLGIFCLRSKAMSEKDLVEISSDFKGIVFDYFLFSFVFILFVIVLTATWSRLDNWALINYGRRFYPLFTFFGSAFGIYQALFATLKGVYPMGKITYFIYDDIKKVRRVAKFQIISSVALLIASVSFFFITSGKIQ